MTCYTEVSCKTCGSKQIKPIGRSAHGELRYRCYEELCTTKTFMLKYRYKAYESGVKEQAVDMAINGSGIRDTGRVLGISKSTVISTLKSKETCLVPVNPKLQKLKLDKNTKIHVGLVCQEAEVDEQWSFVFKKSNQRWLWYAVDHVTPKSCNPSSGRPNIGIDRLLLTPVMLLPSKYWPFQWICIDCNIVFLFILPKSCKGSRNICCNIL